MSFYVIDAGVAVKWFIPEMHMDLARNVLERFRRGDDQLLAPDLLIPECANVFWKRAARGEITNQEAADNLNDLLSINLPLTPSPVLAVQALALAQAHQRSVYDCLYLSLAVARGCHLVTSDERFYNALNGQFPQVRLLTDPQF